jgi:hypothetical protein
MPKDEYETTVCYVGRQLPEAVPPGANHEQWELKAAVSHGERIYFFWKRTAEKREVRGPE